jgi:hypothetical protein
MPSAITLLLDIAVSRNYHKFMIFHLRVLMIRLCRTAGLLLAFGLEGCASGPKPAPQPDMSHLVPVNKSVPSELAGPQIVLPNAGASQSEK